MSKQYTFRKVHYTNKALRHVATTLFSPYNLQPVGTLSIHHVPNIIWSCLLPNTSWSMIHLEQCPLWRDVHIGGVSTRRGSTVMWFLNAFFFLVKRVRVLQFAVVSISLIKWKMNHCNIVHHTHLVLAHNYCTLCMLPSGLLVNLH